MRGEKIENNERCNIIGHLYCQGLILAAQGKYNINSIKKYEWFCILQVIRRRIYDADHQTVGEEYHDPKHQNGMRSASYYKFSADLL